MKGQKMPVKEKVNKSEEVRKLHKSGVKSASEIMAKLKARGITIAPAQVYQVLANKKGKKKNKSKSASHSTEKVTIIDSAVVFIRQAGGMAKAKDLLSKLSLLHE
jgi:arginine repressor